MKKYKYNKSAGGLFNGTKEINTQPNSSVANIYKNSINIKNKDPIHYHNSIFCLVTHEYNIHNQVCSQVDRSKGHQGRLTLGGRWGGKDSKRD